MASDRGVEAGHDGRIMVGRVLVEALMRSVIIEMAHILVHDGAGVSLVVDQQSVSALLTALSGCLVPGCAEPSWGPRMWRYEVVWIMRRWAGRRSRSRW
jgi:hypothetical protein